MALEGDCALEGPKSLNITVNPVTIINISSSEFWLPLQVTFSLVQSLIL